MDKKKILWNLLSIIIAVLTIKTVVIQDQGFSFREFYMFWYESDHVFLILAGFCMCGFFFFEGLAVTRAANILGYSKKRFGTVYGAADVYFSAITPSASGGQPASAYFMIRDGIPPSVTTAILIANLIMYTAALIGFGILSLILKWRLFLSYSLLSQVLIICGCIVMTFLGFCFYMLLRHESGLYRICNWFLGLLEKIRIIRHGDSLREKLKMTMEEYGTCASVMLGHKTLWFEMLFWNLCQRLSQLMAAFFVYLAAGYGIATATAAWHIQNFTVLGSNCIPVPGAMGVADYLMLDGYTILLGGDEAAVRMELLSRSFSFYGCIILSGIVVLYAYFARKVKKNDWLL